MFFVLYNSQFYNLGIFQIAAHDLAVGITLLPFVVRFHRRKSISVLYVCVTGKYTRLNMR